MSINIQQIKQLIPIMLPCRAPASASPPTHCLYAHFSTWEISHLFVLNKKWHHISKGWLVDN